MPSSQSSPSRRSRSRSRSSTDDDGGGRRRTKYKDDNIEGHRKRDGDEDVKMRDKSNDNDDDDGDGGRDRDDDNDDRKRRHRGSSNKKSRHRSSSKRRKKKRRRGRSSSSSDSSSSSSSSDDSSSSSSSSSSDDDRRRKKSKKRKRKKKSKKKSTTNKKSSSNIQATTGTAPQQPQMNEKLLSKLSKRNETLEEREERRAKRRAARITARFGYTPEDNPFRDPNLHETFTWKKKEEIVAKKQTKDVDDNGAEGGANKGGRRDQQEHTFAEIEKVRQRREARDLHLEEMERLRAEESRMKELENYDEWAKKEEEFHLQQQRQRSAIRLVEGREKPVDVLAQNMLLFGLSNDEKENRAKVKYRERYNALEELETLETNLEEPYSLLKDLKLNELQELLIDVDAFRRLEKEAAASSDGGGEGKNITGGERGENTVIQYWDAIHTVTLDEIQFLKTGGDNGGHASLVKDICDMFNGQSMDALLQMKSDIEQKLRGSGPGGGPRFDTNGVVDTDYWTMVLDQLKVHLAKMELSEIHSKMLVRQLEKLEVKREELQRKALSGEETVDTKKEATFVNDDNPAAAAMPLPQGVEPDFGNLEEELGLNDEIDLSIMNADGTTQQLNYAWQNKYRPRKPRYFNRVKTGYDWNAYNRTHFDHDNPPPKIVQGYKFNVFYPDLIDKTKTPQYFLERADRDDFCILRFSAGPPYEDVAFKIINRQWNKSRKRGFRCTFERGVLSLYFNFAGHWYRR